MKLYLVQHAEAKKKDEDPDRALTEKGKKDIHKIGKYFSEIQRINIVSIIHSGKTRAKETAEILSDYLKPALGVKTESDLDPMADSSIWANKINQMSENIMLIGHLPHLKKLSSLLLTGTDNKEIVSFQMGGVVSLEKVERDNWQINWIVVPEIL